ncbi:MULTISPECIES: hypothetical protein [unclassified Brevundimonas]|uniref:hypothetical protein n=1 Tax=unclassified Brevundimonas TaxID=2622653 RepID=UPI0025BB0D46|nr:MULTISPECIES: hypothetical protein [unclassified Brevundimonas]
MWGSAVVQPALACVPLPSPRWDIVPQQDGPPIAVGRVVSVVPDGGDAWKDIVRLEIETLEVIQGEVPDRFSVRGISARREKPDEIVIWCGRLLTDKPGDVVMAVSNGGAQYDLLMPFQIAAPYLARLESYRNGTGEGL